MLDDVLAGGQHQAGGPSRGEGMAVPLGDLDPSTSKNGDTHPLGHLSPWYCHNNGYQLDWKSHWDILGYQ